MDVNGIFFHYKERILNHNGSLTMTLHIEVQEVLAIVAGILILFMPKLLNYIVAIYLIVFGIVGLIQ